MRARIPSCMRAPPDAATVTSGTPSSAAPSHARANFSPTALPMEPPMKAKSMTARRQARPPIAPEPTTIASPWPVFISASASRSLYGPQVEEVERVLGAHVGRVLLPRARVGEMVDARAGTHGEVVTAMRTHPRRAVELVVAVVRLAARAGVRMRAVRRRGRVLVLDGYVDAAFHGAILDPAPTGQAHGQGARPVRGSRRRPQAPRSLRRRRSCAARCRAVAPLRRRASGRPAWA